MKIIEGDLIALAKSGKFDVIVHGSNCFHTMGGGIALQIKNHFPAAYQIDCNTKKGDIEKLGTYSKAIITIDDRKLTIVNAYTQFGYGGNLRQVNYEAVAQLFNKIKNDFIGKKIGYPMIGAGLAGGDWKVISAIIDSELQNEDHTLVIYKPHYTKDVDDWNF